MTWSSRLARPILLEDGRTLRTLADARAMLLALPDRDMRAKRPPLLSFLLRWSTMRRLARVLTLLALDFAGVFMAIFTALVLKDEVRGLGSPAGAFQQIRPRRVPTSSQIAPKQ